MKSIFLLTSALATATLFAADSGELKKAPELAFTLPGQGPKLLSQYRGKVVALEFILTTCPHCQAAAKVMTKYQQELGGRGLQVIDLAINALDDGNSEATATSMVTLFAMNFQVGFPVGYIPRDSMMAFMGYSIMDRMVVPQLVLIDRKGFIHYRTPAGSGPDWEKVMNETTLHEHIEELLALNSPPSHASKAVHIASASK